MPAPLPGFLRFLPNSSKKEWQKDALDALTNLIKRKVDLDINYFKRAKLYFEHERYAVALSDIDAAIDIKDNVGEYYLLRAKSQPRT